MQESPGEMHALWHYAVLNNFVLSHVPRSGTGSRRVVQVMAPCVATQLGLLLCSLIWDYKLCTNRRHYLSYDICLVHIARTLRSD